MGKSLSLVPTKSNSAVLVDVLGDLISKKRVSLQTMLNADSVALSACDMQYFPKDYWGKVPSYPRFMSMVRKECPEIELELREIEAETLGEYYEREMRGIFERPESEMDGMENKRFSWGERLYKMQERKLDRIAKQRDDSGVDKGVDLAVRVIGALSNAQLLKAKEVMEAEWKENER